MSESKVSEAGGAIVITTPLRREIDEVLTLRGGEREARLLQSENLAPLVAVMPAEELYFTIKEMDPGNVTSVLSHARAEQVELILDLELWERDRIRRDRVPTWLSKLVGCGDQALTRWLTGVDPSTWALMLGNHLKTYLVDEDSDPFQDLDGKAPFTVDGVYYLHTSETLEPLMRRLITAVKEVDDGLYQRLMVSLTREADSELEEHCYQDRQKRLAVRGFDDWEEAMAVYAPPVSFDVRDLPARPVWRERETEVGAAPRYPLSLADTSPDFLAGALRRIKDPEVLESFRADVAHLTNKVVVADGLDLDRMDSFHSALRKVAAYASVGLEKVCGGNEQRADEVVGKHWLLHLFQLGWSDIRDVSDRAWKLFERGWPQGHKERLLFLDSPLPETLEGLLRRHPMWYVGEEQTPSYRWFRTQAQLAQARERVAMTDFLGRFLLTVVDLRLGDLQQALVRLDTEALKGSTVFLTAMVNAALGREFRFAPIERSMVRKGLALIWDDDRPPRRMREGLGAAAVEWSKTIADLSADDLPHLQRFVSFCFRMLEEEFGHLASDEIPDPRFTRGLWIQ